MKITRIEPILIAVPYRFGGPMPQGAGAWRTMDTLLVRVETDEGLIGWGEAFGFGACAASKTALETLGAPLSVGRALDDHDGLIAELRRKLHNYGADGPVSFALSGLDIALWDIAGKHAGQPISHLLGGAKVARMPAYASLLRYGDAALVARNVAEAVARGYRHIKLHEIGVAEIAAARRAAGPEIELMVDANCAWSVEEAIAIARQLAPLDLKWLEEPLWPPSDHAGLARIRRDGGVPIAAGENAGTFAAFDRLVELAAVDFVQPSVTKIGGISELRRVSGRAERAGIGVAPHSPYFGPGLVATLHVLGAGRGEPLCERFYCDLEASPFGSAIDAPDGQMSVPSGPGLGVEIDESIIARYRIG